MYSRLMQIIYFKMNWRRVKREEFRFKQITKNYVAIALMDFLIMRHLVIIRIGIQTLTGQRSIMPIYCTISSYSHVKSCLFTFENVLVLNDI